MDELLLSSTMDSTTPIEVEAQRHRFTALGDSKTGALWRRGPVSLVESRSPLLYVQNAVASGGKMATAAVVDPLHAGPTQARRYQRKIAFAAGAFSQGRTAAAATAAATTAPSAGLSGDNPIDVHVDTSAGEPLALYCAVDQRGHVFAFDLVQNKHWLVARVGVSARAITFGRGRRKRDVIVGLADHAVHCYNVDTTQMVAKLQGYHQSGVDHVTVHPTQPLLLTASATEAILWDTEKWARKRVLTGAKNIGVVQASFSASGDRVFAFFKDHTIMAWALDGFAMTWKVELPGAPSAGLAPTPSEHENREQLMSMCAGRAIMAAASNETATGPSIFVWDVAEKALVHEITIPAFSAGGGVRQVQFVGKSTILAVLAGNGQVVFLDAAESRFVCRMPAAYKWKSVEISADGCLMSLQSMDAPSVVSLWSLQPILNQKVKETIPTFLKQQQQQPALSASPKKTAAHIAHVQEKEAEAPISTAPIAKTHVVVETSRKEVPAPSFYDLATLTDEHQRLNRQKLRAFLRHFGEFPEKYRILIWRFLLQLPENRAVFQPLAEKKIHPSLKNFRALFPMKSDRVARGMEKVISSLIYWSPIFENLDYLPSMVFPMVKAFGSDVFSCFEAVMTVIINWCQFWWAYYPNPPIQVLDMVEDLLALHDKELLDHFTLSSISTQVYAWPMIQTLFSEVFAKDEWLKVWDHILANDVSFFYFVVVAYLHHNRASLLRLKTVDECKYFFSRANPININLLLGDAYRLMKKTPKSFAPILKPFHAVDRGHYPVFNAYPEYIVNYQKKLREKIRMEEEDYLRKKKITDEIQHLSEELRRDQKEWAAAEWTKNDMMEKWWNNILSEEDEYIQRKSKVEAVDKERRVQALRSIANARHDFVNQHLGNSARRTNVFDKSSGVHKHQLDEKTDMVELEEKLGVLESEWTKRRNELITARQDLDRMERDKINRVLHGRFVNVEGGAEHSAEELENQEPVQ